MHDALLTFHVSQPCLTLADNALSMPHGGIHDIARDAGAAGNILTDGTGSPADSVCSKLVYSEGPNIVIGRTVVVHVGLDDNGMGNGNSLTTGNSGSRVVCPMIRA